MDCTCHLYINKSSDLQFSAFISNYYFRSENQGTNLSRFGYLCIISSFSQFGSLQERSMLRPYDHMEHGEAQGNEEVLQVFGSFLTFPSMWQGLHIGKEWQDVIIVCNARFKPPTYDDLSDPLLHESMDDIHVFLDENCMVWRKRGCTIMSDRWNDGKNWILINILVSSSKGFVFLTSMDASTQVKSVISLHSC